MPTDRPPVRADRCPNCNAFLPAIKDRATHKRCTYCGVEVDVPRARPELLPSSSSPSQPPASPSVGERSWLPFILPLAVAGGLFFFAQKSRGPQQESFPKLVPPPATVSAPIAAPPTAPTVPPPSPPVAPPPVEPRKSRHRSHDTPDARHTEPCHVSGMQMSAVVEANQTKARRCFDSDLARFPKDVGLTSSWEVEVDGTGQAHAARGRLHLLDFKRNAEAREQDKIELPGAAAMSCAEGAIRAWSFPAYSPKDGAHLRMKCSFNFVIKDL